jgi:translation initiation factor 3 subunit C
MSRFFKSGLDSESESEEYYTTSSESGSESQHSEESDASGSDDSDGSDDENQQETTAPKFLKSAAYDDSDSDADEKRVVRSAKDKQFDELRQGMTTMENAIKINDWASILAGNVLLTPQLHPDLT